MSAELDSGALRRAATALGVHLDHPAAIYVAGLSPGSRRTTMQCVRRVAYFFRQPCGELAWAALSYAHVAALRSWLIEKHAPATARVTLAALKGVLKACVLMGQLDLEGMRVALDVGPVRGHREPAGRALEGDELARLFAACEDGTPAGARDAAILALFYAAGLRRGELVRLDVADVCSGVLRVRKAKGNKDRRVPIASSALERVEAWLAIRGPSPGALFLPRVGATAQTFREGRLGMQAVYQVLASRAVRAGVPHFAPHDMRRTYAGNLLDVGVDIRTIQKLLGHSQIATTASYDRRDFRCMQDAAAKLPVPVKRKAEAAEQSG